MVALQEAVQSLLAAHFAIAATHPLFSPWKKQNIFFTLMVSFSMVVLGERRYRSPQGRLAEQNQPRPSRNSLSSLLRLSTPLGTIRRWCPDRAEDICWGAGPPIPPEAPFGLA